MPVPLNPYIQPYYPKSPNIEWVAGKANDKYIVNQKETNKWNTL